MNRDIPELGGYKDTPIGRIPTEWDVVKIEEISKKGTSLSPEKRPNWDFKYIDVSCISPEKLSIVSVSNHNTNNAPSRARKLVKKGNIIFSTVRPYLKQAAIIPEYLDGQVCSTAFCVITPDERKCNNNFIFQAITTEEFIQKLTVLQTGTNYPAITENTLLSQLIPLPPLPEQQQITVILSTVDAAIADTDAIIAKTEQVKNGLMQDLLSNGIGHTEFKQTPIGRIPLKWEVIKLDQLSETITKGATPTSYGYSYTEKGINFIKIESIDKDGNFLIDVFAHIDENTHNFLKRSQLQKNDILISIAGALGRVGIVKDNVLPANTNQAIGIIRVRKDYSTSIGFIFYFLKGVFIKKIINNISVQSAQSNISLMQLRDFLIPLPPIKEQQKIVSILLECDRKLDIEHQYRSILETLKKGLMQDLLTGRVRVKIDSGVAAHA